MSRRAAREDYGAGREPGADTVVGAVADLASAGSGVEYVYELLGGLVAVYGFDDAVVVVDDPTIGRQAFRAGRLPVGGASFIADPLEAEPGLYVSPDRIDASVGVALHHLCEVALQLDLRGHDASHDALTGLFNRRSFEALLRQSASRSSRYGWPFALALVDLDRFKSLNDSLGHGEGDRVLRLFGAEIRSSLRGGDAAARVGGDEFALILSNGGPESACALLERVRSAVASAVEFEVDFSVGVSVAPDEASDPASLYRLADSRLYDAKRAKPAR